MNPCSILTGLCGQRGKVGRQMVYNGALRVEDDAHTIIRNALTDYLLRNAATLVMMLSKRPPELV